MPYSGIPTGSATEAKIDKCVKRVMRQGHDKSAAIAICRASIGKAMNEIEEVKEVEQDEKMDHGMHEMEAYDDYLMGVMSFAELDSVERANEQASKLGKIIHTFTRLARNITNNPAIDPMERSSALRDLTEEMRMRLDADFERGNRSILLPTIDGKFDREYLEKLLKSDEIFKAVKTEGGVEYQASDYADVPDMNMPSTWKLRLAEGSSGNFTIAQIARAITAMQPGGFRGNQVTLTQPKATVVSKISTAINKADGTNEQKEGLRQRLNAVKTIATNTGFKVLQTESGYRWLGWVSNKFIDREGEILTEDAHKDYVAWLDANPKAAPELWTYHIPGTGRKNRADFWTYLNGFLILGGKLTEQEAKAFESCDELGMSHGFYVLDKQGNLINKYRTFEATVLPYQAAANLWTKFTTKDLEIMAQKGMSQAQRELAIQLHGEDFVSALENDTNKMNTVLSDAGVQSKENQIHEDAELVEEVSTEGVIVAENQEAFNADDLVKQFTEAVTKQLNPEGLQAAIKAIHEQGENNATAIANITKRLEALEKSDDEKLAKELSPVIATGIDWMGGFRASQAKETVVKTDEKEKFESAKPNESWVSEAFNLGGN